MWLRTIPVFIAATSLLAAGIGPAPAAAAARQIDCDATTPIAQRPVLRAGDKGNCVRTLKNLLLTKAYSLDHMWPDESFDSKTVTMLGAWQSANHHAVTSVVKPATWQDIEDSPPVAPYSRARGPNQSGKAVLSFDDCPRSRKQFNKVIKAAEKLNIALVLFPTGQCLRSKRFSVSYALAHGHYVFNHSTTHKNLAKLSKKKNGYKKTLAELGKPGVISNYGRPPYGAMNAAVERAYTARGMRIWTWTYDTRDWTGRSRAAVVNSVVKNATANSTILMHMQHKAFDAAALKTIVQRLRSRGVAVCANYPGTTPAKPDDFLC